MDETTPVSFTLGGNVKYELADCGSYFAVTPRSSFRSISSRRLSDDDVRLFPILPPLVGENVRKVQVL